MSTLHGIEKELTFQGSPYNPQCPICFYPIVIGTPGQAEFSPVGHWKFICCNPELEFRHPFHLECIGNLFASKAGTSPSCPCCRTTLDERDIVQLKFTTKGSKIEKINWDSLSSHWYKPAFARRAIPTMRLAAQEGNVEIIEEHLAQDHIFLSRLGEFPLQLLATAAECGHLKIVHLLLKDPKSRALPKSGLQEICTKAIVNKKRELAITIALYLTPPHLEKMITAALLSAERLLDAAATGALDTITEEEIEKHSPLIYQNPLIPLLQKSLKISAEKGNWKILSKLLIHAPEELSLPSSLQQEICREAAKNKQLEIIRTILKMTGPILPYHDRLEILTLYPDGTNEDLTSILERNEATISFYEVHKILQRMLHSPKLRFVVEYIAKKPDGPKALDISLQTFDIEEYKNWELARLFVDYRIPMNRGSAEAYAIRAAKPGSFQPDLIKGFFDLSKGFGVSARCIILWFSVQENDTEIASFMMNKEPSLAMPSAAIEYLRLQSKSPKMTALLEAIPPLDSD